MANNGGLLPTPYWDRFDIVEAHYWHAADWHGGQWSELYAKLCRIGQYYTPGMLHRGYESLTENGKAIYDQLVRLFMTSEAQ